MNIIELIDNMIDNLQLIKKEVANGTPERIDALDLLTFVSITLTKTYAEIKNQFKLSEES